VQLAAPNGAAYHWSTGATSQTIAVGQPGTYAVLVTGSAGDTLTLRHRVTAFVPPPVVLSGDTVLCAGRSGQVAVAAAGATGYRWNTGQTTAAIAVGQPGTYTVTAFFGSGCSRQVSVRVRAQPALPPLTLGADTVICEGQALTLRVAGAPAGDLRYRWSDNSAAPTRQVHQSGHYTVQLTSACETRTLTRQVRSTPCLTLPTIITPNADHLNDSWVVQGLTGEGWELELFSRWGQRVYHTANYHNEWGESAAAGLYYYLLRHAASNTARKGWVEVVR
jgi:gliding motility-associated-like protein